MAFSAARQKRRHSGRPIRHPRDNLSLSTIPPCSRIESVPFLGRNGTAAPAQARLFAAIKREDSTLPSIENGTVAIKPQPAATKRLALRVVGEPSAPPRRQRNGE